MTDIPEWAFERAAKLTNAVTRCEPSDTAIYGQYAVSYIRVLDTGRAFARYIAEHEKEPVDPLLEEAREIAAKGYADDGLSIAAQDILSGRWDKMGLIKTTLTALRRGIELAKERDQ